MSTIQDFLGKGKTGDRSKKYQELSKDKTEAEKRELEMHLLKPDKIPPHVTESADYNLFSPISTLTVRMVFPDEEALALFKKHFPVSKYVEPSLARMDKMMATVQLYEDGKITYDAKTNKVTVKK